MKPASLMANTDLDVQGPFEVHDAEFGAVLGPDPRLVRVVETDAHEGPVYVPAEDALYFTTLPRAGNVLFIHTDTAVWAAVLQATGSATAVRRSSQHPKGA